MRVNMALNSSSLPWMEWKFDWLIDWLFGWLFGWLIDWLIWLMGWMEWIIITDGLDGYGMTTGTQITMSSAISSSNRSISSTISAVLSRFQVTSSYPHPTGSYANPAIRATTNPRCVSFFTSSSSTSPNKLSGLNSRVCAVLGAQWGDEGKGKLVDVLAKKYDIVARFNGGANAGHTLVVDGKKFAFHTLPCGMLSPGKLNVIGNGVVLHVPTMMKELNNLSDNGVDYKGRLKISDRAHLLFDFHQVGDLAAWFVCTIFAFSSDHHSSDYRCPTRASTQRDEENETGYCTNNRLSISSFFRLET